MHYDQEVADLGEAASLGQKAPSAKRCIKTTDRPGGSTSLLRVRKHRAPKGALRRARRLLVLRSRFPRQKAPSAKRCIKTDSPRAELLAVQAVRKHRAPKGALRPVLGLPPGAGGTVRKHRAPNGALRLHGPLIHMQVTAVRKHRAPNGALRR